MVFENRANRIVVRNIATNEAVTRIRRNLIEISKVPRISEQVVIDNFNTGLGA
jgi:hypothetical protein